jgi:hypothetical protein
VHIRTNEKPGAKAPGFSGFAFRFSSRLFSRPEHANAGRLGSFQEESGLKDG